MILGNIWKIIILKAIMKEKQLLIFGNFQNFIRSKGEMIIKMKWNKNSCYRNGVFIIKINFSPDYPKNPSLVEFKTTIYHVQYNNKSI